MFNLQESSAQLAKTPRIDWKLLDGSSVLITGATGLIGTHCVRLLLERNRVSNTNIKVYAMVRNMEKAHRAFEDYTEADGLFFIEGDVVNPLPDSLKADYVIHAACPTASAFFQAHPAHTARSIVEGTRNVLDYARKTGCHSCVYISSMEVYGTGNSKPGLEKLLKEDDLGFVDPMQVRSCYPEGKRMAENYCCCYASEYDVPVKVIRLAQTFGPGIPKTDKRIFADFLRCAHDGNDIVLRTTGESTRMYLYTDDAVAAIFTVILKGENGNAYNAANPRTYSSVKDLAEMARELFGKNRMKVQIEIDPDAPYPPEHHLPLDVSKLQNLGWQAKTSLPEMLNALYQYLFEQETVHKACDSLTKKDDFPFLNNKSNLSS